VRKNLPERPAATASSLDREWRKEDSVREDFSGTRPVWPYRTPEYTHGPGALQPCLDAKAPLCRRDGSEETHAQILCQNSPSDHPGHPGQRLRAGRNFRSLHGHACTAHGGATNCRTDPGDCRQPRVSMPRLYLVSVVIATWFIDVALLLKENTWSRAAGQEHQAVGTSRVGKKCIPFECRPLIWEILTYPLIETCWYPQKQSGIWKACRKSMSLNGLDISRSCCILPGWVYTRPRAFRTANNTLGCNQWAAPVYI